MNPLPYSTTGFMISAVGKYIKIRWQEGSFWVFSDIFLIIDVINEFWRTQTMYFCFPIHWFCFCTAGTMVIFCPWGAAAMDLAWLIAGFHNNSTMR